METIRVARRAMGTRFEVLLQGEDPPHLRAAAEEALDEIDRLDGQLSTYRETSEISRINVLAGDRPVQVEPTLFALLMRIAEIYDATDGAFDPTVGPLMEVWGFVRGTGKLPDPADLRRARELTGMDKIELDPDARTIRFVRQGMRLDLGGIGKGYALEEAARVIAEAGVRHGIIHGGTSTVCAVGPDENGEPWKIAIPRPGTGIDLTQESDEILSIAGLVTDSLSVSAVRGKAFEAGGRVYGHVLDPRRGEPVRGAHLSAVVMESGTDADALSTALLVLGSAGPAMMRAFRPNARFIVALDAENAQGMRILEHGLPLEPPDH